MPPRAPIETRSSAFAARMNSPTRGDAIVQMRGFPGFVQEGDLEPLPTSKPARRDISLAGRGHQME